MAVLRLYLLALFLAYAKCSSYVFSNTIVLDSQGNYNVSYNFNESADTLEFMVEVRTTGWVGFGFALNAPNNMTGYDVAVGGVSNNGTGYIKDYLTNGFPTAGVGPPLDSEQNWHLTNSTEQNGVTTLKFYRKRNTTDANDIAIEQGTPIFIVWAYASSDVEPGQFVQHASQSRGVRSNVTLIPDAAVTTMVSAVSTSTSAMAAITTSTMAAMTTSTLASMSASIPPAVTTSTLTTMTTSVVGPPTTTPVASSSSVVMPTPMPVKPEHFANFVSLGNGKYNASWMFNSSTDTLHFMVEVRATGWVGFGVATQAPTNMNGYDVAVGGVFNGSGYLKDYYTSSRSEPPEDSQQDWMPSYYREENGVTTLRFYRKRNTTDQQNDTAIQQGMPSFLIWAYHSTSDVQPGQFQQHSYQGFQNVTFIAAAAAATTPTPAATTPTPTPTPTPVKPVHFSNFVSFDDGKYNASWMFDSCTDTLHFMVQVRATGWIGFGVATQAPTSMVGYDVAVGGVLSGSGYLKDYFTGGRSAPPEDTQKDWMLSYSSEENGVTTLRFYRKRDTNDQQKDVVIQQGMPMHLIWAYHSTNDVEPGRFQQHSTSSRGFSRVTFIPAMPQFTQCFDENRFALLWRFDDQTDMIYYHLRVKTTGWVGFGFAENAPNNMMDYDVIVAGYSNGQGYLWDFKTTGPTRPALDESQDYKLLNASEVDGYTELMFERRPDTKDTNDLAFKPGGAVNIIWAYSASDANNPSTFGKHSRRGSSGEKVVMVKEQPIPTEPSAASTLCSGIYGIVTLTITLLNVLLL